MRHHRSPAVAMLCFNYTVRFLGSVPVLSRLFNAGRSGLSVTDKHTQLKSSACRLRYRLRLQKDRAPAKRIRIADAQRDRAAQAIDGSPTPGERTAPPTGSQRPHQTRIEASARPVQPLEPILVPKVRIRFADFPYLHCSIGQRLFTLETCCGYRYERAQIYTA